MKEFNVIIYNFNNKPNCLEWHNVNVIIEADSEEEAEELALEMEGNIYSDAYCTTEQIDVKEVEPYEN